MSPPPDAASLLHKLNNGHLAPVFSYYLWGLGLFFVLVATLFCLLWAFPFQHLVNGCCNVSQHRTDPWTSPRVARRLAFLWILVFLLFALGFFLLFHTAFGLLVRKGYDAATQQNSGGYPHIVPADPAGAAFPGSVAWFWCALAIALELLVLVVWAKACLDASRMRRKQRAAQQKRKKKAVAGLENSGDLERTEENNGDEKAALLGRSGEHGSSSSTKDGKESSEKYQPPPEWVNGLPPDERSEEEYSASEHYHHFLGQRDEEGCFSPFGVCGRLFPCCGICASFCGQSSSRPARTREGSLDRENVEPPVVGAPVAGTPVVPVEQRATPAIGAPPADHAPEAAPSAPVVTVGVVSPPPSASNPTTTAYYASTSPSTTPLPTLYYYPAGNISTRPYYYAPAYAYTTPRRRGTSCCHPRGGGGYYGTNTWWCWYGTFNTGSYRGGSYAGTGGGNCNCGGGGGGNSDALGAVIVAAVIVLVVVGVVVSVFFVVSVLAAKWVEYQKLKELRGLVADYEVGGVINYSGWV